MKHAVDAVTYHMLKQTAKHLRLCLCGISMPDNKLMINYGLKGWSMSFVYQRGTCWAKKKHCISSISTHYYFDSMYYFLMRAHSSEHTAFMRFLFDTNQSSESTETMRIVSSSQNTTYFLRGWNRRTLYPETDFLATQPICRNCSS